MSRWIWIIAALLLVGQSFATVGIGVNYVGDYWKFNELSGKTFKLSDNNDATLIRDGMSNPSGIGMFVVMGVSDYELQFDAEYAIKKYKVAVLTGGKTDSPELTAGRVGLSATLKKKVFSIPAVAVFAGLGAGVQVTPPVAGQDLVKDLLKNSSDKFEVKASDILSKSNKIGIHVMVQARIKPPAVPFGLQVGFKGMVLPSSTFDKPGFVPSVTVGLGYFPL